MKNLYQCEKCGKTFEDASKAYNCEERHFMVVSLNKWEGETDMNAIRDARGEDAKAETYQPGNEFPSEVIVKLSRSEHTDGHWMNRICFCVAKLTGKPFAELIEN